ncbi:hypothetical protein B0H99_10854 [Planomicrobium soli]|uniref:Uncharacterized protein n=1 Tax=Planomicrobium soli TaxID=1176648 RepID=A0A2P8GMG5_9BACL|nr:hypothetical protein [Planomicrobium soli]PSL35152.1 hypothetical protein B0H99_10854 [Planomicrobium soli]
MNYLTNQRGYALLVVLLVIMLFFGFSAIFLSGSMSHAKQEKTVDTTNQSVAAAEMGVVDYASRFEMDIDKTRERVSAQTQLALNNLISCIVPPTGAQCDTAAKRSAWEQKIDQDMRKLYLEEIAKKIAQLREIAENQTTFKKTPFQEGQISYLIKSVTSTPFTSSDTALEQIIVELEIEGTSKEAAKKLSTSFKIEVPDTFLNPDEALKVDTIVITQEKDVSYDDVFRLNSSSKTCATLLHEVRTGTATAPYECMSQPGEKLMTFINHIKNEGYNPEDFRVYTDSFVNYVCNTNCNSLNFHGVNVIVKHTDMDAFNNMNNLVNANLVINGKLDVGNNLNNLGKNGIKQNIIVKELDVDNNIKMYYTNFLILGYGDRTDANIKWGNHFEVANYSRLCIDIDRINQTDLERLSKEVTFSDSGSLIYFTKDPSKTFTLTGAKRQATDTAVHVTKMDNYTTFLENCGVTLKNTQTVPTDVAVPIVIDTGFDFEVEY